MSRLNRLLRRLREDPGQALIEYLLILPIVFLLVMNIVNFGGFTYAWIGVANAARAGADYAILAGASANGLTAASGAQINSVITADATSLPNNATMSVVVCKNTAGTVSKLFPTSTGSCAGMATDPEPTLFVVTSVDVSYTYNPFISAFSFPKLGVFLTLPPTTIRRVTVMRSIQ